MPRRTPPFRPEPLPLDVLRSWWRTHDDRTIRALLEEVARLHGLLREVDELRQSLEAAWREIPGGQPAALYRLKLLIGYEPALQRKPRQRHEAAEDDDVMGPDPDRWEN